MADDLPLLDLAGLSAASERLYVHVLMSGRASVAAVAGQFELDETIAFEQLENLRQLGLVSRLEGDPPEYAAVDPRYALRAIIDRLSDQALRIREAIPMLVEYFDAATPGDAASHQAVVLTDPDTVAGWYARLQHQAMREFLSFDRPPYVSASLDPFEAAVLARGVDWRAVYTIESFDEGTTWEEVERLAEQGEQARITDDLPVKLAIVDGEIALVSLSLEPGRVDALIIARAAARARPPRALRVPLVSRDAVAGGEGAGRRRSIRPRDRRGVRQASLVRGAVDPHAHGGRDEGRRHCQAARDVASHASSAQPGAARRARCRQPVPGGRRGREASLALSFGPSV